MVHAARLILGLAGALLGTSARAGEIVWYPTLEIATDDAERGAWRQNESNYDYVDDPTVAVGPSGEIAVAWVDQKRHDIFLRRFDGASPVPPRNVSDSPQTFSWLPRMSFDASGKALYLLWQEIIFSGGSHGGDILFARSADGGRTFAPPINLSRSRGGDGKGRISREIWHNGSLDLAVSGPGAIYAAWTEYHGALWFARSTNGGRTFSAPQRLTDADGPIPARAPALATAGERTVYLAWTVGEDATADVRIARSRDGGQRFSAPRIVHPTEGYSDAPKVAVSPDGVLHVVYAESTGGPFERSHIVHARSTDQGLTFSPARTISGERGRRARGASFPYLEVDAQGRVVVLWEASHAGDRARGLELAMSLDGGATFSEPVAVPDSADPEGGVNGSLQGRLMDKLAVGGQGTLAIVNSSFDQGERSRVWLLRGNVQPRRASRE